MADHVFTGFGFGPIQGGLFAKEAFGSGNFKRIVISEIDQKLVDAVKADSGSYYVNVARTDGIEAIRIDNIELLNPTLDSDRKKLLKILADSTEIVTSLPSVNIYEVGRDSSVSSLISAAITGNRATAKIIYTAENNNTAAEILKKTVSTKTGSHITENIQFLNTVIGKMSRVVTDVEEIKQSGLKPIARGIDRAFLVEEFNHILVTKTDIKGFTPGIKVFVEKANLLPFEEAKLFGHNAIHALLAYLGYAKGYSRMAELKNDPQIMQIARDAFINESGKALIKKYADLNDSLFTESGYKYFAEDLLERITNQYLGDTVARAGRDIVRKLGLNDRIFGTMATVIENGVEPVNMAMGALAGIKWLVDGVEKVNLPEKSKFASWQALTDKQIADTLNWLWDGKTNRFSGQIVGYVCKAKDSLKRMLIL